MGNKIKIEHIKRGGMLILLIFLSLNVLLVASCSKVAKCGKDDRISGIIEGNPNLGLLSDSASEFVIDNDSTFMKTFPGQSVGINFRIHTLLGVYTSNGGCNVSYLRMVERQENSKTYLYKVQVNSCGLCKKLAINFNWVLVPKLPAGWKVEFKIEEP